MGVPEYCILKMMQRNKLEIFIDGACRGNPGDAAIGVVIIRDGEKIKEISRYIGRATNNIAEYSALICALQEVKGMEFNSVKIYTDSELVFRQVTGVYKVRDEKLTKLFIKVRDLVKGLKHIEIQHVRREKNKEADNLASRVLIGKASRDGCPGVSRNCSGEAIISAGSESRM